MERKIFLWPDKKLVPGEDDIGNTPHLVPHLLESNSKHSAIVVCPGGGYGGLAYHEGDPVAAWLNGIGIFAFVLKYRVAPHRYPCAFNDVKRSIQYIRHNSKTWNIDVDKIGVLGFSAGGHLASTISTHFDDIKDEMTDDVSKISAQPNASILCYPVITFGEFGHQGSLKNLTGEPPDPTLAEYLSNEKHIQPDTPPTFLWHTADDNGVPVENSLLYAKALRAQNVPFEMHIFPQGQHGLGLAKTNDRINDYVAEWPRLCERWLRNLNF